MENQFFGGFEGPSSSARRTFSTQESDASFLSTHVCFNAEITKQMNKLSNAIILSNIEEKDREFLNKLKNSNLTTILLTQVDKMRKSKLNRYTLKRFLRNILLLNKKIMITLTNMRDHSYSGASEFNFSLQDYKEFEEKMRVYEAHLNKSLNAFPLLDKEDSDILNIFKEMQELTNLEKKIKLLKGELEEFSGLKPDLKDASLQLEEIKQLHKLETEKSFID